MPMDKKSVQNSIEDTKDAEQVLRGIQPKHQTCYKIFKGSRLIGIFFIIIAIALFILTRVGNFERITNLKIYRYAVLFMAVAALFLFLIALIDKALFLRKAPFDDWVFEIAEKRLGTSIIFYDSHYIYINYDRGGKEVDKREFVSEMSDKSIHYSYYYIKTFIDEGVIMVECKKRQPIPNKASFSEQDDKYWNIIPMGLTINPNTQSVSAIGWYLNDQNINDKLYTTVPSTSILICGGTGCHEENAPILMYNTLIK
jgi:hypothetical protein